MVLVIDEKKPAIFLSTQLYISASCFKCETWFFTLDGHRIFFKWVKVTLKSTDLVIFLRSDLLCHYLQICVWSVLPRWQNCTAVAARGSVLHLLYPWVGFHHQLVWHVCLLWIVLCAWGAFFSNLVPKKLYVLELGYCAVFGFSNPIPLSFSVGPAFLILPWWTTWP